ncbi:MAG: hypothetical protein JKY19_08010 [Alcanivoracaceae bacterium]|nr:hypothetical protein [Alcanivoracaceae bacterium]
MNITEFHHFISEVAEELPETYSRQLMELRDCLGDLNPNEWGVQLEQFANNMLLKNIGNSKKLVLLQAEAEKCRSVDIKPIYLFVAIIIIALIVYYV